MNISKPQTEASEPSSAPAIVGARKTELIKKDPKPDEIVFKLGLWFSGLDSFLDLFGSTVHKTNYMAHDWSQEFRLTHSVLLKCSKYTFEFLDILKADSKTSEKDDVLDVFGDIEASAVLTEFDVDELFELSNVLRESILISEGMLRAKPLGFKDWAAWNNALSEKFKSTEVISNLIEVAEREARDFIPEPLKKLLRENNIPSGLEADLKHVFPYFARLLKWLDVIGIMLREDRPLKPALLIFARIHEQMKEMMDYINNRLSRYPNEEDALFGSLDSAAYTASIELRKVYDQELRELISVRPVPLVVAKIENSYCLLNDSLQLTLVNFAELIDPKIQGVDIFPNFGEKEEQSIQLRQELWEVLQEVQIAEREAETYSMDSLRIRLRKFSETSLGFIFYKDIETVERFIEEITLTRDSKDVVPTLHRFGAYLETLLGQVNMRSVLAKHPFEGMQGEPKDMFS